MFSHLGDNFFYICSKILSVKSILKTLFIFLFFSVSLLFSSNCETQNITAQNYIQNDYQKVVLVAQNITAGEITAPVNNTNSTFGHSSNVSFNSELSSIYLEKTPQALAENIHNLSTYLENEISIRAP